MNESKEKKKKEKKDARKKKEIHKAWIPNERHKKKPVETKPRTQRETNEMKKKNTMKKKNIIQLETRLIFDIDEKQNTKYTQP